MPGTTLSNRIMTENKHTPGPHELQLKVIKMPEIKEKYPFSISFCNYFTYYCMKAGIGNILELSISFEKYLRNKFLLTLKIQIKYKFLIFSLTQHLLSALCWEACRNMVTAVMELIFYLGKETWN